MALSNALRSVVTGMTAQFGERVLLRSKSPGVFVASENRLSTSILEWDNIPAAVIEVKYAGQMSRLQIGDKKFIIGASALVPEDILTGTWEVDFGGVTYKVLFVDPVRVSGVNVAYTVGARGPSGK